MYSGTKLSMSPWIIKIGIFVCDTALQASASFKLNPPQSFVPTSAKILNTSTSIPLSKWLLQFNSNIFVDVVNPLSSMIPQTESGKSKSLLIVTTAPPIEIPIRNIGVSLPKCFAAQLAQSTQSQRSFTPKVKIFPSLSSCARILTSKTFHFSFCAIL